MASVLKIKIQTNQASCLLPADLHKATPFHGRVQRVSKMMTHVIQSGVGQEFTNSILLLLYLMVLNPYIIVPCQSLNSG